MKVQASLNNLRIAPRKVRLVTHSLIGVDTREALIQLQKQVKKTSGPLYTLLQSAIANAKNNFGLDENNLYIYAIHVGDGLRLQRWLPRAFGRATPLIRRGSNVKLILEERIEGKNRTEKKQPVVKEVVKDAQSEETETKKTAKATVRPEVKKESSKVKPSAGKAVKKVFQRKAA